MATYDLDQTTLNQLLNGTLTSTPPLSSATNTSITNSLSAAGLLKHGTQVVTEYQNDTGANVTIGMDTIVPNGAGFFLEVGSHDTINVTSSYGAVIAAGDGANIKIIDSAAADDTLVAGAGDDTLVAAGGYTYMLGGSGHDSLVQDDTIGYDTLQGGTGTDTLTVHTGSSTLIGGKGSDSITAGTGYDTIYGTSGVDTITTVGGGHTTIFAGTGSETINAQLGADTIYVGYQTNYSTGTGGADTINAGGVSNTVIHVNANQNGTTAPVYGGAPDGGTLITFTNGGVTTSLDIKGHATVDYLNKSTTV